MISKKQSLDNYIMLKTLEDVDLDKAIEVVSNPNLDTDELTNLIELSILNKVTNKETGQPLNLSKKVLFAALINIFNQEFNK